MNPPPHEKAQFLLFILEIDSLTMEKHTKCECGFECGTQSVFRARSKFCPEGWPNQGLREAQLLKI